MESSRERFKNCLDGGGNWCFKRTTTRLPYPPSFNSVFVAELKKGEETG
jgi:hypothetical protein